MTIRGADSATGGDEASAIESLADNVLDDFELIQVAMERAPIVLAAPQARLGTTPRPSGL